MNQSENLQLQEQRQFTKTGYKDKKNSIKLK